MPWMSDTTAMIDVTATMLPSTVRNDRSLFAQIAWSAIAADFEELVHFCGGVLAVRRAAPRSTLTAAPSRELAHRAERTDDDAVASFRPESTSKYFSPAMPVLTGTNIRLVVPDHEDAFDLLALLAGLELGRLDAAGPARRRAGRRRLADDAALVVEHHLAHGRRLNRHRQRVVARRGRDLGGAGEAGPDVRDLAVERAASP